jgi:hypothetical protein
MVHYYNDTLTSLPFIGFFKLLDHYMSYVANQIKIFINIKKYLDIINMFLSNKKIKLYGY